MSPRVTYWTGIWEPHREALSKEIQSLRQALGPRSPVISFSAGQRSSLDIGSRVVRLSANRYPTLRLLALLVERTGDVTHVFGSLDCWHLLKSVGRRPTLLTVVSGGNLLPELYDDITMFAVQAPLLRESLLEAGVAPDRIRLVYPGIDLTSFNEAPARAGHRFTVLFASTPADPAEFEDRGIPIIVEAARLCPEMDFVLLWRQWGNLGAAAERLQSLRPPANVTVRNQDVTRIEEEYARSDAVICCFAKNFGKTCPNSVMEALACGRPALVTADVGLAPVIGDEAAGVVVPRSVTAVKAGLEKLREGYGGYQGRARQVAEAYFDLEHATAAYGSLYRELANTHGRRLAGKRKAARVPETTAHGS